MSDKFVQLSIAFFIFILVFALLTRHLSCSIKLLMLAFAKSLLRSRIKILYAFLCLLCRTNASRPSPIMFVDFNLIKFLLFITFLTISSRKAWKIITLTSTKLISTFNSKTLCNLLIFFYFKSSAWLCSCGDIESNPGPPNDYFKFMHWNANSLPAHNFARIALIETYNSIHQFNLIAITETALKNEIPNEKIDIPGFTPIRCDLPNDDSHGGVMIYHKTDMAVKNRSDLTNHSNSIVLELSIARKKVFFIVAYRKRASLMDFNNFVEKFGILLSKIENERPHCTIITGDFNAHSNAWYNGDKTDIYGSAMKKSFDDHNIFQLVHDPTYITKISQT